MQIILLVIGLLLFVLLVVVHEFGHFIMARRNGVDVEEFGIGFPPKAMTLGRDKKGTEYTLNWLPLGGFVRLKGEHDADTAKGSFGAASLPGKVKIMLAGVVMNLATAWLLFSLLALVGIPKLPLPTGEEQFTVASDTKVLSNKVYVGYVEPGGPADKAGIKSGDIITESIYLTNGGFNGKLTCNELSLDISSTFVDNCGDIKPSDFYAQTIRLDTERVLAKNKDVKTINLSVQHKSSKSPQIIIVTPRTIQEVADSAKTDKPVGYLGIVPYDYTVQRSTWSAPIVGAGLIAQYSKLTYSSLGSSVANLFKGHAKEAGENVSGPIGIFVVLRDGASFGPAYILLIIALLSLTLAIMNTLPIPALDGGKLFVMLLFRAIKKPLTPMIEERIHGSGFLVLMLLFVVITFVDIKRFF
jgi:regulator of sigma E protease